MNINSLKDLKNLSTNGELQSLDVNPNGKTLVFKGLKWANYIYVHGRGKVIFPDLKLITGNLDVTSCYVTVKCPVLEEIIGEFIEPEPQDDFECLRGNINLNISATVGCRNDLATAEDIANDSQYTLYYSILEGEFIAGCRTFKTVDQAIEHWKSNFEKFESDLGNNSLYWQERSTRAYRALMFVFALTNFKEEMRRGGLLD